MGNVLNNKEGSVQKYVNKSAHYKIDYRFSVINCCQRFVLPKYFSTDIR